MHRALFAHSSGTVLSTRSAIPLALSGKDPILCRHVPRQPRNRRHFEFNLPSGGKSSSSCNGAFLGMLPYPKLSLPMEKAASSATAFKLNPSEYLPRAKSKTAQGFCDPSHLPSHHSRLRHRIGSDHWRKVALKDRVWYRVRHLLLHTLGQFFDPGQHA